MAKINRSLAIVIGINQYTHIPQLKNAVSDAAQLAVVLKDTYGYEVLSLLNKKATKDKLDELVISLQNKTIPFKNKPLQVDESDRLLFYFAGHGFAEEAQESEESKPAGYFMPQNAEGDNRDTWLSMEKVYQTFTNLDCHHLLMILDCCFAGRISWVVKGRNAARPRKLYQQSYEHLISHPTQQIFTSAAYDEESRDMHFGERKDENGHSPFAHLLLKVLNAKPEETKKDISLKAITKYGVITAQDIFGYLQKQLKGQTPNLFKPRNYDEKTGRYVFWKGEYVFPLPHFNPENLKKLPLNENTNPYKSLDSFETKDSELFYGRKRLIEGSNDPKYLQDGLLLKVSNHPLTIMLGVSRSGKSSLVKAGLIPALQPESEANKKEWYVLNPIQPGEVPLTALAKKIQKITNTPFDSLVRELQKDSQSLTTIIKQWSQNNPHLKLLLTIDQSEQLITLSRNEQDRKQFLQLLQQALVRPELSKNLRILLVLRSEFEPQIRNLNQDINKDTDWQKAWQKLWQNGRFLVTPMNREELQQVIEEPAAQRALFFESPKLVNDLIDEVVQMPGALPLLSFTLSELYLKYLKSEQNQERNDRTITEADYKKIDGVTGFLTKTAQNTYIKLKKEEKVDESTIRDVMLRMVTISGDQLARRRVPTSEFVYPEEKNSQVQKVIKAFYKERLLVKGLDAEQQEYVEPVHDALITEWKQIQHWDEEIQDWHKKIQEMLEQTNRWNPIKKWLNDSRSKKDRSGTEKPLKIYLDFQRQLTTAAFKYEEIRKRQQKKVFDWLWDDDPRLPLAEQVFRSTDNWLNKVETDFVQDSIVRHKFKTRRNWSIAGAVFTGSIIFSTLIWLQLQRTELREKAANVENLLNTRPVDGLILAIDAMGQNLSLMKWLPLKIDAPVRSSLLSAVQLAREQNHFQKHEGFVNSVAFSPDGKVVSGAADGKLILWDIEGNLVRFEDQHDYEEHRDVLDGVVTVAVSPDGEIIVTGGGDYNLMFWKRDGNQIKLINNLPQENIVTSVAFSSNGQKIAGAVGDKVFLWNREGQLLLEKPFEGHEEFTKVNSIAFNPEDGQTIVTGGSDGKICLWSLKGKPNKCIKVNANSVNSIAISPDGQTIASGGDDGKIRFWSPQLDRKGESHVEHEFGIDSTKSSRAINSIDFHPNGQIIVSGGDDGTIRLWNLRGEQLETFRGHNGFVISVAFSPDGETIASGGSDFSVRLWETRGNLVGKPFTDHNGQVNSVAFSSDGEKIVSGGQDGIIYLRNLKENNTRQLLPKHNSEVTSLAFSLDGERIVSGGQDGMIYLRSLKENDTRQLVPEHNGEVTSLALSLDGERVAIGGQNITTYSWKLDEQPYIYSLCPACGINTIAFSPQDEVIVSGHNSGEVRLWNIKAEPVELIIWKEHFQSPVPSRVWNDDAIQSSVFSPDNKWIVAGGRDRKIRLLKKKGKFYHYERDSFQENQDVVNSLTFSPDSQSIVSGGKDGKIFLWNLQGELVGSPFMGHWDSVTSVAFSPDGKYILSGSLDGTVRLWYGSWEGWLDNACNRLKNHPILVSPNTEIAKNAGIICQKYVWNNVETSDFLVNQGLAVTLKENFDEKVIAKFKQAKKLNPNLNLAELQTEAKKLADFLSNE